jgi:hypothetical protein
LDKTRLDKGYFSERNFALETESLFASAVPFTSQPASLDEPEEAAPYLRPVLGWKKKLATVGSVLFLSGSLAHFGRCFHDFFGSAMPFASDWIGLNPAVRSV